MTDVGSIGEEDVQVPVVVVIEYGHTPGHSLGSMAEGSLAAIQDEPDGPVSEVNRRRRILPGYERTRGSQDRHTRATGTRMRKGHWTRRPGRLRSGGGAGSSAANFFTFSNSACASC